MTALFYQLQDMLFINIFLNLTYCSFCTEFRSNKSWLQLGPAMLSWNKMANMLYCLIFVSWII